MTTSRSAVTWRYLPAGAVKHALRVNRGHVGHDGDAVCGSYTFPSWWRGTGGQIEYDRIEGLRECGRCARLLAPVDSVHNQEAS